MVDKILKASKFCLDYYEKTQQKAKDTQYHKNQIKRFYKLLQKVANIKYILFGCHICNKVFRTKQFLENHIQRRHDKLILDSLHSSLNSHLSSIPLNKSTSTINFNQEINNLLLKQQQIKEQLEEKLKELSIENPKIVLNNTLSPAHRESFMSIGESDFQMFLKEISSKPSSPPPEEINRNPLDLLMAAHALDLNPVTDTHYLYIARQFLEKPLPKN